MAREPPTNQYNHQQVCKRRKISKKKTFCLVLLNEDMALLKLVTLRSEESSPSSVAAIFAINSSGSGRHLGERRDMLKHFEVGECRCPGPLKCFCAPSHHILAKSAPKKRVVATKLISRQKCVNQVETFGAHLIRNHCWKGAHLTL